MAEFHLAASVSGSSHCNGLMGHLNVPSSLSYNAFLTLTSQNVCSGGKKTPVKVLLNVFWDYSVHRFLVGFMHHVDHVQRLSNVL